MEYTIPVIVIAFICIVVFSNVAHRRKFCVVKQGVDYPNNHHVMGVGYYHAASQRWFPHPWNEYREDRGYYWNGTWNTVADQRMVLKSRPDLNEVQRVNQEWRSADPDRARKFWETVEHEGFGTAIRRSEGS